MRFLLLGRHRETGEVRLVSPETYTTRQDALDDLGASGAGSDAFVGHDLFVVDLDVAVPVVFYQAPAAPEPADEPMADVWEAPAAVDALAEISTVEDAALEGPAEVWAAASADPEPLAELLEAAADEMSASAEPTAAEPTATGVEAAEAPTQPEIEPEVPSAHAIDLAEALRRAADHLESQGIVEPPIVEEFAATTGPENEPPAPDPVGLDEPLVWPWETVAPAPAPEAGEETVPVAGETAAFDEAPAEEPTVAEPPLEEPTVAEPPLEEFAFAGGVPAFQPVGIDEPGLEDITLLTPASEDAFEIRPVIVGEYSEPRHEDEENPFAVLESLVTADAGAVEPGADAGSEAAPEAASEPEPFVEPKAYEPGGTDIATYTCADCIYAATCPKANQEGPATCGSFQWTSV